MAVKVSKIKTRYVKTGTRKPICVQSLGGGFAGIGTSRLFTLPSHVWYNAINNEEDDIG
jgi:hypothetical protein